MKKMIGILAALLICTVLTATVAVCASDPDPNLQTDMAVSGEPLPPVSRDPKPDEI